MMMTFSLSEEVWIMKGRTWLSLGHNIKLLPSEAYEKQIRNRDYLMELSLDNLLLPYRLEAGVLGSINYTLTAAHGGWDNPLSQIRGTFTGHWLSAVATLYAETEDIELKMKADSIVAEIKKCQEANGGEWLFPIPEKYLFGLKEGKKFWAPHYVCHKVLMGLFDMHRYAKNEHALDMVSKVADWFLRFTADISRKDMDEMMNLEETGGIMELWADLFGETNDTRYKVLLERYERPELMNPLLEGLDILTNLHANTTIPEVHGMARAYEVTGDEKYRKAVESFWNQAVTERGQFATGGQTCGEIWTPPYRQLSRLGETNQEHCVVYNMIRLADYLFRWSGDAVYADYIEQNIYNGLFAQGYWRGRNQDSLAESIIPDEGLIAYYLPLAFGSTKKWGRKTEDFWCCHCTLVQANANYRQWFLYQHDNELKVSQYFPFEAKLNIEETLVKVTLKTADVSGGCIELPTAPIAKLPRPTAMKMEFIISAQKPIETTLAFRIPWWTKGDIQVNIEGAEVTQSTKDGFLQLTGIFDDAKIEIALHKEITTWPLLDAPHYHAFLDGPILLAGLTKEERTLYVKDKQKEENILIPHEERKWTTWQMLYQTTGQPSNFLFKPLKDIGHESYTVYFPVEKKEGRLDI